MKLPIGVILSGIEAGIPALERVTRLFRKKHKTNVDVLSLVDLQAKVKQLESANDEHWFEWFAKTALTLATVWVVVWSAKQLGVTYQDIITLMGLIK